MERDGLQEIPWREASLACMDQIGAGWGRGWAGVRWQGTAPDRVRETGRKTKGCDGTGRDDAVDGCGHCGGKRKMECNDMKAGGAARA